MCHMHVRYVFGLIPYVKTSQYDFGIAVFKAKSMCQQRLVW